MTRTRCRWAGTDPDMIRYHDDEWGVPSHDDRHLFEMLILEGAQAGLSWSTILRKRGAYQRAFSRFNPAAVARYDAAKRRALLRNTGIVRNRLKIDGTIRNARAFLDVQREFGSFDAYIWQFVGGRPIVRRRRGSREVPATTLESDTMSRDLKRRGFTFVGSTICYAFMQAVGMADDHAATCFKAGITRDSGRATSRPARSARPCARVVLELIASDPADVEVLRLRVAEVQAAHRGRRQHRERLGQRDADSRRVEQPEQRGLLAVIGTGRIAERRPDAAVLLADQVLVAQSARTLP